MSGADVLLAYLKLVEAIIGIDGLMWYMVRFHIWHGLSLTWPAFGLIDAAVLIIAMRIATIRFQWWRYAAVIGWGLLRPAIHIPMAWALPIDPQSAIHVAELPTLLLLWMITRSKVVIGNTAGFALAFAGEAVTQAWATGLGGASVVINEIVQLAWHPAFGVAVLWWAIFERRHPPPANACRTCCYDLTHLSAARCPECGTSLAPRAAIHCTGGGNGGNAV